MKTKEGITWWTWLRRKILRAYWLLLILLGGCYGEPVYLDTVDIWPIVSDVYSEQIAEVTPECEQWLVNAKVLATGSNVPGTGIVLSDLCSDSAGCHVVVDGRSYIWCGDIGFADDTNICYGHEYLHALSYCMTDERDSEHEIDGLWCDGGYLCPDMRGANTDSVEFRVNERIWETY